MFYSLNKKIKLTTKRFLAKLFLKLLSITNVEKADFSNLNASEKNILARLLVKLAYIFKVNKADFSYFDLFEFWEQNGFHLIPDHFYQPLPNLTSLNRYNFKKQSSLVGIDMNDKTQLNFMNKIFPLFKKEYRQFPYKPTANEYDFYFGNGAFDGIDALVLYCMIRYFKPETIIEVGSGWSTRVAARASLKNEKTKLISIEPYPYGFLKKGFPGLTKLIKKKVEDVDRKIFTDLNKNDILFIDSSHVVKTGGDVQYLFLEVLPRLKEGVVIHIHDIFLPYEYPRDWVVNEYRFWNEQYLLQAFLTYNNKSEILFANNYMGSKYKKELKKIFFNSPTHSGGSIWLRKV